MKNWIIKLVEVMAVIVAANMLIAGIMQAFHLEFWSIWAFLITAIALSLIFMIWVFKIPCNAVVMSLFMTLFTAISYVGNQWAYYSADETVHLKNIEELLAMPEKPLYFTLDEYKYDKHSVGYAEREYRNRKGRRGVYTTSSITYYEVAPLYTDSVTEEAKAWIARSYTVKPGQGRTRQFAINADKIVSFELLTWEMGYFKDAFQFSRHPRKNPHPVFISPLYKPHIPKSTWGKYFLMSLAGGAVVMMLAGAILNRKERDEEEA